MYPDMVGLCMYPDTVLCMYQIERAVCHVPDTPTPPSLGKHDTSMK